MFHGPMPALGGGMGGGMVEKGPQPPHAPLNGDLQEVEHVRSVFPETWLWSNATVR